MNARSDQWDIVREKVLGLDGVSIRKAYYPELQQRLQELERFRSLLDHTNDAFFLLEVPSGKLVDVNEAVCTYSGISREELLTKSLKDLIPASAWNLVSSFFNRTNVIKKKLNNFSTLLQNIDGSNILVEMTIVLDVFRKNLYAVAVARDITERNYIEETLAKKIRELAQSNSDLEQFASIVSHDLREPLRVMTSFSKRLRKLYQQKLPPDADYLLSSIIDGATRMDALINGLLEYSRVGIKKFHFEEVDCDALVDQVCTDLKISCDESSARIIKTPLPVVKANQIMFGQLFQNLISNALKFRETQDPVIEISARKSEDEAEWIFSVKDNGIGIDPKYFDRIFVIFKRLHTRDEYAGTGIGLAVCKKIVERHGGRIWVESTPGNGATFSFTIPIEQPQQP